MKDQEKAKEQLISELEEMRQRIAKLEVADTERKRAEENLKAYLESAPDGIYINDLKGTFLYGNKKAEEIMRYKREELIGKSFLNLKILPGKHLAKAGKLLALNVMGKPTGPDEFEMIRKDGSHVWVEINTTPIKQQESTVVIGFVRDITERKRVEGALRESEERLRDLLENANDLIQSVAPDGHFLYVNKAWRKILGYSEKDVANLTLWDIIHPDSISHFKEVFQRVMSGKTVSNAEAVFVAKDGKLVPVEGNVNCRFGGGKPVSTRGIFRDITERKRTEERLRESERRYRLLAENAEDVIWTVDMNMRPTYMSPSITRLLGYSVEEAMAKPMEAVYTPASFETAMKVLAEELAIENMEQKDLSRSRTLELELNRKDGSIVPVEVKFSFIREPDGRPANILAIARDITERKQMEHNLHERIKKLKCLYGISKFAEIPSITLDELYQEVLNLLPSVWHYPEITGVRITINGKKFETENYIDTEWEQSSDIKVHGARAGTVEVGYLEERPEIDKGPFLEEERLFIDAVAEQLGRIAERKRVDEALRESEQRFRSIFDNATDGILVTDTEDKKFYTGNKMICQMLGYSQEEIQNLGVVDIHPKEDLPYIIEQFEKQTEGESTLAKDIPVKRKDGSVFYAEVNSSWVTLAGKTYLMGIFRDITERKRAEEKIEELYQKEKELRQKLETQIQSRVEFTRALIHELKTPLTPIVASSGLLVEELREPLLSIARNINQSAVNLSVRIDELLDVARGELDMIELDLKPVDILKMSRRVAAEMAPMISSSKQSLILDLPPTFPAVSADESRLGQVVMNLLNNASKFTPEGGKITIRVKQEEAVVIVSVQDNGPGISKEEQKRIFDLYYHKESDRQRLTGLGLGLALSKMLVELHRGRIWVESRLGAGATFSFSIPLGPVQQEPKATETGEYL